MLLPRRDPKQYVCGMDEELICLCSLRKCLFYIFSRAKLTALGFVHIALKLGTDYEMLLIKLLFHHKKYLKQS